MWYDFCRADSVQSVSKLTTGIDASYVLWSREKLDKSAVNIALLTIYDMVKAVDRTMVISNIHLVEKSGGRSGLYKREVKVKPKKAVKKKK